jgi:hypothetical protein
VLDVPRHLRVRTGRPAREGGGTPEAGDARNQTRQTTEGESMRRLIPTLGVLFALVVPSVASAATIEPPTEEPPVEQPVEQPSGSHGPGGHHGSGCGGGGDHHRTY